jgi:hypothetical protein
MHSLELARPENIDILLLQTWMEHLLDTPQFLGTIPLFETLHDLGLHPRLTMFFHLLLLDKLVKTNNIEQALKVYESMLHCLPSNDQENPEQHTPDGIHAAVTKQIPDILTGLFHGLHALHLKSDFAVHLIAMLPPELVLANRDLTIAALRYAAFCQRKTLVHFLLAGLPHPLYEETYVEPAIPSPRGPFSPEIWSAILFVHTELGYINSSRWIIQSMIAGGVQPRNEDLSAIVAGTTQVDLNAGYEMAVQLSESIDHTAYEVILEIALERGDTRISEWAKGYVAYEGPPGPVELEEDQSFRPASFEMPSLRTDVTAPTCTPRARGLLIKHIAQTDGLAAAILTLLSEKTDLARDVYDTLFTLSFKDAKWDYAQWISGEMRRRGWMPRDYRAMKLEIRRAQRSVRKVGAPPPKYRLNRD